MICEKCGTTTQPGSECANCGSGVATAQQPAPATWSAPPAPTSAGSGYSTAAIVLGVIAVFLVPILFGGIGIVLASIAKSKGEEKAGVALAVSIVGTVAGLIFGAVVGAAVLG